MTTTAHFLTRLKKSGVDIRLESEGQLAIRAKKGAMTAALKEELRLRKDEIVAFLQSLRQTGDSPSTITPVPADVSVRPSFAQERLWFFEQMEPGNAVYMLPTALRLNGDLDTARLEAALAHVIQTQDSLRMAFPAEDDTPTIQVVPRLDWRLHITDLSGEEDAQTAFNHATAALSSAPFQLDQAPLFRIQLFRFNPQHHVLLAVFHHIIMDDWSIDLFHREWRSAYQQGESTAPEPRRIGYRDYAQHRRTDLTPEVMEQHLTFWRERLNGLATLEFPTDRPHPPKQTYRGAVYHFQFEKSLGEALKALGREQGATLYMSLLAVFKVLLHGYTGQTDITVGAASGSRDSRELEQIIGLFVNLLVLRTDLSGAPTFRTLLHRVKDTVLSAHTHREAPFERVVETCHPDRDGGRHPLFQIQFVATGASENAAPLEGLEVIRQHLDYSIVSQQDMTLAIADETHGLDGFIEYNTDLFDRPTIVALIDHFKTAIAKVTAAPDQPINRLSLLTEADQTLLAEWNQTTTDYGRDLCLHQRFEAMTERFPDATALIFENQPTTYTELNQEANQLAHHLLALGVGVNSLVGVCLPPGPAWMASILAILKAGAAYVPLDPDYPDERLAFMLHDSGIEVLLTFTGIRDRLRFQSDSFDMIFPEEAANQSFRFPLTNPNRAVPANAPAYVMYTSGSTGQPKGVSVTHRGVMRLVVQTNFIDIRQDDVFLQASALSFDAATLEIWGALLNGAALVLSNHQLDQLPHLIETHRVTILWLTAQLFHIMVDEHLEDLAGLRYLLAGGDVLSPPHIRRYLDRFPNQKLINGYGPTENTTFTTCCDLGAVGLTPFSAPIGTPIANTAVHILNAHMAPVPIGVIGELYISGDGLAMGYWHRGALTAEKFVPNPFATGPEDSRLYRTGDTARRLSNGQIEFHGRRDNKVKIRGFRIELDEIESVIHWHPAVAEVAVVVKTMGVDEDDKILVAYVSFHPGMTDTSDGIRAFVEQKLPRYMAPAHIMILDAMPLLANGKLDRDSLPDPHLADRHRIYTAPRNDVERTLTALWCELLGAKQISVFDNFFDLGCHSLLLARAASRLRTTLSAEITVNALFEHPSVAELAHHIQSLNPQETTREIIPVANRTDQIPLSFAQERLFFMEQLEPGSPVFLVPEGRRLHGALNVEMLEQSLRLMIQRHEVFRTSFGETGGAAFQRIHPNPKWHMELEDLSGLPAGAREQEAQSLAADFSQRPFDLTSAPLFRALLMRLGPNDFYLAFCTHHIITDDWSLGNFHRDWISTYNALVRGREPALPVLPLQYADFCIWQRRHLDEVHLAPQLDFWKTYLADAARVDFPTTRPRPPIQTYAGENLSFKVDPALTRGLQQLAKQHHVSMYMILLAALQTVIHRYTGQTDITIGTSTGNRAQTETEPIIGLFVNLLAMRTDLSGDPGFDALLERVRTNTLSVYDHQDIPFEKVVEACRVTRDQSRHPLFQIQLVFTGSPQREPELHRLEKSNWTWGGSVARVDLTMAFHLHGENMDGDLEFNTDLFDTAAMTSLIDHLQNLLAAVVATPDARLSKLPLMSANEQISLDGFNHTTRPFPTEHGIHHHVEVQAERRPQAPAVKTTAVTLTYAELNERANRIAHYLIDQGVTPDAPVGVCLEPGADLIAVILGILKAGAVYVPLNADYPAERLGFMLTDTAMSVLITDSTAVDAFPSTELNFINLLILDEDADLIDASDTHNPNIAMDVDQLAYVVYTSGTTGNPKGVQVTHRNVLRLIFDTVYMSAAPGDNVVQASNVCFDALTFEVWTALIHGATLCVVEKQTFIDPDAFYQRVKDWDLNTLFTTTALFNQFANNTPTIFADFKTVLFGGEQVDPVAVRTVLESGAPKHLRHVYGPTETTTFATWYPIEKVAADAHNIPIGVPIANTTILLLDRDMNQVPTGVDGEVHIGGAGLARGYLNRPELTADKFIPDPFSPADQPGGRLYRTGDVARRLTDGAIEFRGRRDNQVKIRGFRIEPGEIETVLFNHSSVENAVVMVKTDPDSGRAKRLVAYILHEKGEDAATLETALRDHLKDNLPDYMIPSALVLMDDMPLTANGKIDRRALPEPQMDSPESQFVAPRTPVETAMATVWCDVLQLDKVGVHDNFFDLGGDSLISIQIKAKARDLGMQFELQTLFEFPTIAQLALKMDGAPVADDVFTPATPFSMISDEIREALPPEVVDAYPLTHLQVGMVYHGGFDVDTVTYHEYVYYDLELAFQADAFRAVFEHLARRHEILRTRFELNAHDQPIQYLLETDHVPLTIEDLRHMPDREAYLRKAMDRELHHQFDWRNQSMLRIQAYLLTDKVFRIVLSFHHAVMDGWSEATLFTEFLNAYRDVMAGRPIDDTRLNTHFKDYVRLEQRALNAQATRDFWAAQVAGMQFTPLPRLFDFEGAPTGELILHQVPISQRLSDQLQTVAGKAGVPIKAVLFTAHLKMLSALCGSRQVTTGFVTNGRPETADSNQMIGLFLNTLPFRYHLNSGSWIQLIQNVFRAERELWPHRHFPLSEIRNFSDAEAFFDTGFNFTHFHAYNRIEAGEELTILTRDGFCKSSLPFLAQYQIEAATNQVTLQLDFDPKALPERQVEVMARYALTILEAMGSYPDHRHERLNFLTQDEHRRLQAWNRTDFPVTTTNLLYRGLEQGAAEHGHLPALIHPDQTRSYAELNADANRLSHHLIQKGIGAGDVVGVLLPRTPHMVTAMLAVLKTGAAYLPLDPNYPAERIAHMTADARLAHLLTHKDLDHLAGATPALCLDGEWPAMADDYPQTNPEVVIHGAQTAYLIYTSGSTGLPKGVAISHQSATAMLTWAGKVFNRRQTHRVAVVTSMCFDLSIFEIFLPLTQQGAMVLLPDALDLAGLDQDITLVNTVPSAMTEILAGAGLPKSVTTVNLAGEPLRRKLVDDLYAVPHVDAVYNLYGPSEDTTYSTFVKVPAGISDEPTIGRPIDNTKVFLVDSAFNPTTPGIPGELCLAGSGLATGYLHKPGLTAERFTPNPFAETPGERLYRTGDRARFRADGELEFLGRLDHQIKLRGFRIELGEIETLLQQHPQIIDAAAAVRAPRDAENAARLVAWITGADVDLDALRTWLAERLPAHMVPADFQVLETMPLTPNGKLDRKALPDPNWDTHTALYVAPRTPTEQAVADLWAELLGLDRIGIHDNVLERGGQSLLLARAGSRLRHDFNVDLPIKALFLNPTTAQLAAAVDRARDEGTGDMVQLTPVDRNHPIPPTFAQERLWFLEQLEPGNRVFHMPEAWRLTGALNTDALDHALRDLIQRHETLRMGFREQNGKPVIHIVTQPQWELETQDISLLDGPEQDAALARLTAAHADQPFDLSCPPLFRAALIRLGDEDHVLMFNTHHIVSDALSLRLFHREWVEAYNARLEGREPHLRQLTLQYADYAAWQRHWFNETRLAEHLSFWQNHLSGLPTLDLPLDFPRPPKQTYDGACLEFRFSRELSSRLQNLALANGVSPFMILLAGFQCLLARYTGQTDIGIGTSIGSRNHKEIEPLLGLFVNLLTMRTDLSGDPDFTTVLERVRRMALEVYAHQDAPFEKVVEACHTARDLSRHPLFQVQMIYTGASDTEQTPRGLVKKPHAFGVGTVSRVDLTLAFAHHEGLLEGALEYNTALFQPQTMARLLERLQVLFHAVTDAPHTRLSQLPLMTEAEIQTTAVRNQTTTDWPRTATIASLFEACAAQTPDAVALQNGDTRVTYAQLNQRANRMAHYLIGQGVGVDEPVGVCLRAGVDWVVSILALLKAGGAYVPFDPEYPTERLSHMLSDSGISVLITANDAMDALPTYELTFLNLFVLDEDEALCEAEPDHNPPTRGASDTAAYIMYTSGSTGVPKGVLVTQGNVIRLVRNTNFVDITPSDVFLQAASISFDAATFEIWGALLNGATLALPKAAGLDHLVDAVTAEKVTILWLTSQLFNVLVDQHPDALGGVRQLLAGGDALSPYHVRKHLAAWPKNRLINGYGPTEGTTFSCCHDISRDGLAPTSVPIGVAVANTRLHILDTHFNPVPDGVIGDLFIAGDGLARGYLNQPDLTAAAFVPDPMTVEPGGRLYRTGDRVRRLDNGFLEFHGRQDHQVKIRGYRIELEEIDMVLSDLAAVRDAVVIVREPEANAPQVRRLAAYLCFEEPGRTAEQIEAVRDALRDKLPDYMIPAHFIALDTLPMTVNGKVDRAALPAPESDPILDQRRYTAPETPEQVTMAAAWAEALHVERVGLHDNFFELGGDSLLSIQVKALAAADGLHFDLHQLFEYPTVASLLAHISRDDAPQPDRVTAPFDMVTEPDRERLPDTVEDAYPVSRLQIGMLFHGDFEEDSVAYHDLIHYTLKAPLNRDVLKTAVQTLAARHGILRTAFEPEAYSEPLQLVYRNVDVPLTVTDLSNQTDPEAGYAQWMEQEKRERFVWNQAPLFRVFAFALNDAHFRITFSFHHAILDGWSEATLFTEFLDLYLKGIEGVVSENAPEPLYYRDYIALEQQAVASELSQRFWDDLLSDHTIVRLPKSDQPVAGGADEHGNRPLEIAPALSNQLHQLAVDLGLPVKSVLLAAHLKAVGIITGQTDVITGVVTNGRPETQTGSAILGLFLNTLPLRFQLARGSWTQLIQRTFALEKKVMPFRRFPLPEIMNRQGGERLFDTTFNYTHFHVYENLGEEVMDQVVVDRGGFAKASIPLVANFQLEPGHAGQAPIRAQLDYDPTLITQDQAEGWAACYESVLNAMAATTERNHEADSFLDTDALARINAFNQTTLAYPQRSIPESFALVAANMPEAPALCHGEAVMTYGDLDTASNRLAHYLISRGVRPGSPVGFSLGSGFQRIVTVLGILKAGGCYVPIDPDYPPERIRFMVSDAGLDLLLTSTQIAADLDDLDTAQMGLSLVVIENDSALAAMPGHAPDVKTLVDDLAYITYTSGTTGLPKGVCITHANVNRLVFDTQYLEVRAGMGISQVSNSSFDAFTFEVWTALLHGARLCLMPKETYIDPSGVAAELERARIDVMFITTALFNVFVRADAAVFSRLSCLLFGGEAVDTAIVRQVLEQGPPKRFLHVYGPTESTTFASWHAISQVAEDAVTVPIGRPIANSRFYVMDPHLNLVPPGVPGELLIAGDGLARGYLNRADQTAERFVPDPVGGEGARLYRTGDLVRLNDAQAIEFIGRVDRQIKLRGFRIEPAEIEFQLRGLDGVLEAVVQVRKRGDGHALLIAYIRLKSVTEDAEPLTPKDLRDQLSGRIPEFMMPGVFVIMDSFPLTNNGKIDTRALPMPDDAAYGIKRDYVPPRTPSETLIVEIWSHFLNQERIGINDHFFELGGHSLMVARVVSRLRETLKIDIPIKVMFDYPVAADLAHFLDMAAKATAAPAQDTMDDDKEFGEI